MDPKISLADRSKVSTQNIEPLYGFKNKGYIGKAGYLNIV